MLSIPLPLLILQIINGDAWFGSLEEAERAVLGCGDFLWDNYYETAVIEEVPRGAITPQYRERWYEWNGHAGDRLPSQNQLGGFLTSGWVSHLYGVL